jgi:tight adherence protein C
VLLFLLIALALTGLAVGLIARAIAIPRARTSEILDQIPAYGFKGRSQEAAPGGLRSSLDGVASLFGGLVMRRLGNEAELRNQLLAAGLYRMTPRKVNGYRLLAAICTPAAWAYSASATGFSSGIALLGLVLAAFAGWSAPVIVVRRRARRRLAEIDYELPELIDLLVVTVEAGLGFNGSMQVAADRFRGPLGDELRLTLQEQNMGLSTSEALRNLLGRCETPAMRSFVRAIVQGESLGVSIGQIMRNLAVDMRKRRRQNAEERAQRAPIKILFPLIFFIFPAMFVVLLAPAVFAVLDAFGAR